MGEIIFALYYSYENDRAVFSNGCIDIAEIHIQIIQSPSI